VLRNATSMVLKSDQLVYRNDAGFSRAYAYTLSKKNSS
jgi:hypothetical protein